MGEEVSFAGCIPKGHLRGGGKAGGVEGEGGQVWVVAKPNARFRGVIHEEEPETKPGKEYRCDEEGEAFQKIRTPCVVGWKKIGARFVCINFQGRCEFGRGCEEAQAGFENIFVKLYGECPIELLWEPVPPIWKENEKNASGGKVSHLERWLPLRFAPRSSGQIKAASS